MGCFYFSFFFFFSINALDLMPHLICLTFGFISHFFLPNYHISTKLDLSHLLVLKANSLHLWLAFRSNEDPIFFCRFHGEEWTTMIPPRILSLPSCNMGDFMFHINKFMSFCHLPFSLFTSGLTLCYWLMAFIP